MIVLLPAGALLGLVLGRFFKVFVLAPICGVIVILAFSAPDLADRSFGASCVSIGLLLASLQFGYLAGVMSHAIPALSIRRRLWSSHTISSRPL